jgi:hypothetical protein
MRQHRTSLTYLIMPALLIVGATREWATAADPPWAGPLVEAGGDIWRTRAIVHLANHTGRGIEGEVIGLRIGSQAGQLDLAGKRGEAIRVCDDVGRELLFDLTDAARLPKHRGVLVAGDRLSFGVSLPAGAASGAGAPQARYVVYYDNPKASPPADYFRSGLINGGFEAGSDEPYGWRRSETDSGHSVSRVADGARSGRYCASAVVEAGAKRTWAQWMQNDIPVSAGVRYRFSGWVRADGVKGKAGWYVHVHAGRPMVINQVLDGGEGTYGWKRLTTEFTAPNDAKSASVGSLRHGGGVV